MKVLAVVAGAAAILATGCGRSNSLGPPPSVPLEHVAQSSSCGVEDGRPPRDGTTYFIGKNDLDTVESCFVPRYRRGLPVAIGFHWLGVDTTTNLIFSFDGKHLREREASSIDVNHQSNASWTCQSLVATTTSVTFDCGRGTTTVSAEPASSHDLPGPSHG